MDVSIPWSGSQIQTEIDRINFALNYGALTERQWLCLYVARLTIDWITNPSCKSPYDAIVFGGLDDELRRRQVRLGEIDAAKQRRCLNSPGWGF